MTAPKVSPLAETLFWPPVWGPQDGRNGYGDVHAGLSRNGSVLLDDIDRFLGDSAIDDAVAA